MTDRRTHLKREALRLQGFSHFCSVYVPAEECGFCCFEARDAEAVREANRRAGVPFWRVVDAEFVER